MFSGSLVERVKRELVEIAREVAESGPGRRLPSEAELAEQMGVSRATVRSALGDLAAVGLVVRRHGLGTFVAEPPDQPAGLESLVDMGQALAGRCTEQSVRVLDAADVQPLPLEGVSTPSWSGGAIEVRRRYVRADVLLADVTVVVDAAAVRGDAVRVADSLHGLSSLAIPDLLATMGVDVHRSFGEVSVADDGEAGGPYGLRLREVVLDRDHRQVCVVDGRFGRGVRLPVHRGATGTVRQLKVW